jgi:exopolysaccharide production protein ExoZ
VPVNKNTILSLQFSRGLAAILVVIAHAIDSSGNFGSSCIGSFKYFQNFGAIGVDIFFVISGAIMVIITSKGDISPGKFLLKRCIRVLPLYWAVSAFCLVLSYSGYWPSVKPAAILQTITVVPFFKAGYNAGHILFLGWTLSFEFYFYIVFALALLINRKNPFAVLVILLLLPIIAGYTVQGFTDERLHFFTNPIILEFLAGCCCGYLYISRFHIPKLIAYLMVIAGVALMILSIFNGFGYISEMNYTWDGSLSMQRVIRWGVPSALFVTGLVLLEKNKAFSANRFFVICGDISYATYLSHIFSIMIVTAAWHHAGLKMPDFFILVAVPFSLLVAYAIHRLIEKPVISYINKIVFRK